MAQMTQVSSCRYTLHTRCVLFNTRTTTCHYQCTNDANANLHRTTMSHKQSTTMSHRQGDNEPQTERDNMPQTERDDDDLGHQLVHRQTTTMFLGSQSCDGQYG